MYGVTYCACISHLIVHSPPLPDIIYTVFYEQLGLGVAPDEAFMIAYKVRATFALYIFNYAVLFLVCPSYVNDVCWALGFSSSLQVSLAANFITGMITLVCPCLHP